MEVRFNVTKDERRALVTAISEILDCKAEYQGAPSFAFKLGDFTIDRVGTMTCEAESADVRTLLMALTERGFAFEGGIDELAPVGAEPSEPAPATAPVIETPEVLAIEIPLEGFTRTALENLEKLVAGKGALIRKALGLPEPHDGGLPIERSESALLFPWFPLSASKEAADAYALFVSALCDLAKKQKRVTMKESDVDSEKFAMRCFLLRLGFIGDEYKSARRVLLSKLSGSGSFKSASRKKNGVSDGSDTAAFGAENGGAVSVRDDSPDADSGAAGGVSTGLPQSCGECMHHCFYGSVE